MRQTGRTLTMGLSLPLLAVGGFTIKAAANFEAAMNRVRGITRANAEEFQLLREQAKLLGRTTQFSASQAAEAMENLSRTGFTVQEVYAALPGILDLAASSSVELGEAAKLGAGMLNGFGFEASEMSRINDKLVTANLSTQTTLESIVETLKEVAPLARSAGMDFGEMAAVAGFMGDALLEGGRGGVAMKNMLANLSVATPRAQQVLSDLKIPKKNLIDSKGNVKSLIAVVDELNRAGATAPQIFEIFGKRAAPAMLSLMGAGAEAIQDLTDKINGPGSLGEAQRQAQIRMEGAEGAVKEFRSAIEGLQIAIGDSGLLGAFEDLVDKLTEFTQGLAESNPEMLRTATIIAGVLAVVGPLIIFFGALAASVSALLPVFAFLGKVFVFVWAGIKLLAVAIGIIATALGAPVWLVVAAVAALAAGAIALIKYWEPVKEFFTGLGESIGGFLGGIGGGLGGILGLGGPTTQLAGATAGGGSVPVAPPAQAQVAGQIGVTIESEVPARVTTLETSGDVEIAVDSGPGMGGF